MMSGWIKLHRSLINWEWYRDIPVRVVFEHLLLTVNFENANFQGRIVPRGAVILTLNKLAADTGLSTQQVRTALKKLQSTNNITCTSTNKFQLVTVVNYGLYQEVYVEVTNDTPSNKQITSSSTSNSTNKQHAETVENKEVKPFENIESNTQINKQKEPTATNDFDPYKESKNQEYNNINNISSLHSDIFTNPPVSEDKPEKPKKEYIFDGKVIHLIRKHYDDWQKAFPNLNLYAELVSRDDWLSTQSFEVQKKWFTSTAYYLGKRNIARKNENQTINESISHSNPEEEQEDWYL